MILFFLQSAKSGDMAEIWKHKISPYPANRMPFTISTTTLINRLSTTKIAFVTDTMELKSLLNEECHLHIASDRGYSGSLAFAVEKNAPYKKKFDEQ